MTFNIIISHIFSETVRVFERDFFLRVSQELFTQSRASQVVYKRKMARFWQTNLWIKN